MHNKEHPPEVFTPGRAAQIPFFQGMTKLGLPWDQSFESLRAKSGGSKFILAVGTVIEVETPPFFTNLAVPIHIPDHGFYSPGDWPDEFCGYVRLGDDPDENLAYTVSKLSEIFGAGTDDPVSWNAKIIRWDYGGWGSISAVSQRLGKNDGPEAYVELSKSCVFTFSQNYIFPATDEEENALSSAKAVFTPAQAFIRATDHHYRRYTRKAKKSGLPENTIMISGDHKYLIFPHGEFVTIFPFNPAYLFFESQYGEPHNHNQWKLSLRLPVHYKPGPNEPRYAEIPIALQIMEGDDEVSALYESLKSFNPA